MKLVRFGHRGEEKPGLIDNEGNIRDLSSVIPDLSGVHLMPDALDKIRSADVDALDVITPDVRISTCVARPGKLICVGLNYKDHAEEADMQTPTEPIIFMKATSAMSGPYDDIVLPPNSTQTDWEVELGVVIGDYATQVSEQEAHTKIAGYCVVNDLSERHFQLERGGQWVKGKSFDTFAPVGPYLVTPDELPSIEDGLALTLTVNDKTMQSGNTNNMIFSIPYLIHYISGFTTLEPGDIIATGTPAGVGMGQQPRRFLQRGDTLKTAIAHLGEQKQNVV